MLETDYSKYDSEGNTDSEDEETHLRDSLLFARTYKLIHGVMDDRARTVDFIGLIILSDLYFSTNNALFLFLLLMVKWFIAYGGSFYVVARGGWIEAEHTSIVHTVSKYAVVADEENINS